MEPDPIEDDGGVFDEPDPGDDELDAREAARMRRRDHDAAAHAHELLRPGMGKVFKQITDSWSKEHFPDHNRVRKGATKGSNRPQ